MTEDGEKMIAMMRRLRELSGQCSLLLKEVDKQMDAHERGPKKKVPSEPWEPTPTIAPPAKWFPETLARFYTHGNPDGVQDRQGSVLAYVSILLNDERHGHYKLTEPLLTAGYFDYGPKEIDDEWEYNDYAEWYGHYHGRERDGSVVESSEGWKAKGDREYTCESWKCLGLPLVTVTNSKDVEEFVNRLVRMLTDRSPRGEQ